MFCNIALPHALVVVLTTFGIVFLAELGDKTQLTAMALATKHPWGKTFIGIAGAFAILDLLAVLVGKALFVLLPLVCHKGGRGRAVRTVWSGKPAQQLQRQGAEQAAGTSLLPLHFPLERRTV